MMEEKQRLFIRGLCKKSLWHFINFIVIPFRFPKESRLPLREAVHKLGVDYMQGTRTHRTGLLMPRYFGKSCYVTETKPLWDYINDHEERILIANETFDRAKQFLGVVKSSIENNPYLHYFFPECRLPDKWAENHRWSAEALDMPRKGTYKEPTFMPIGVGGASQGMHVTKAYLDDLIGKKARDSEKIRMDTKSWFDSVPELLVTPDRSSRYASDIFLIGTHWGPGDLYCQIKEEYKEYKWLTIPPEDMQGNPTWPEKLSAEAIREYKSNPKRYTIYLTQMMNNPIATDLVDFKSEWLRYYDLVETEEGMGVKYKIAKELRDGKIEYEERVSLFTDMDIRATIDPAVSDKSSAARTAIVIVGTDKHNKHFVLEAWARRLGRNMDLYKKVFDLHEKYRPRHWGIETFAQQNFILRALREESSHRGIYLPISELPKDVGTNAKDIRIRSLQDDFLIGSVYIHTSMNDFVYEYTQFPIGQNKDLLDALAYHKKMWSKAKREEVSEEQEERFREYLESRPSTL